MKRVAVIDYGMGNLRSVYNALSSLGCPALIATDPDELENAESVILPGVGSFGDGIGSLKKNGWVDSLNRQIIAKGKPFLGICLGMQLLATTGTEGGINKGLGWIDGVADRIKDSDNLRIPHIGWNDVVFIKKDRLYMGLKEPQAFYFVHSYVLNPKDKNVISGTFCYGEEYAASVEKDNICAVQFHPEKSQNAGLSIIKNFLLKY